LFFALACATVLKNKNYISNKLISNKCKFTSNSSSNNNKPPKKDRSKWKIVLGRSGPNKHSHILASECIKRGKPITANDINKILAYCNIKITEDQLKDILKTPSFVLNHLDEDENLKILKSKLGLPFWKIQIPGVYIFKHKDTGDKYVGSSSQLSIRLNGYFRNKHRSIGMLIPFLKKEKLSNFTLEVIPLNNNYDFRSEIVLEQYYLLDPSFNLNTIRVANNPSGSRAKPLYMYNRDKSILYYYSNQQIDFIRNLNIAHTTFTKHLKNGTFYLGKYVFTREPVLTAKAKDMLLLDLALMLEKDRAKFNRNKPLNSLSKSVLLVDENNNTKLFSSLGNCIEYLRNKGFPATQVTLVKSINANKAYYGFLFKYC
jgi:hypothetical protein